LWYLNTATFGASPMSNLVNVRQLRAARTMAGLTQRGLGAALGVNERQIRFFERRLPRSSRKLAMIERALRDHGVLVFASPSPGALIIPKQPDAGRE
jgi:transcriptional regulator with XRE-family HTH domain